jgi:FG-GAP-like repeat/RTX calcium-binding nonapeptide repeat (4 copies)
MKRAIAVIACLFVLVALAGCSGRTEPASNVSSTSAQLNAHVTWNDNEFGTIWYEYSSDGGQSWQKTAPDAWNSQRPCTYSATDSHSAPYPKTIAGLTPATHYIYRLAGTWCGSGTLYEDSAGRINGTNYGSFNTLGLIARDVASEAGIARTVTTEGENCVFDYNRDGVMDLFLSTHDAAPWQLFRGTPDGRFVETNVGTFPRRDRHGCATGDFNRDGRPDIYASIGACVGTCLAPKELWIQTAEGGFVDRAAQFGITDPGGRGREPITLNANGDVWPDLLTGQAVGVDYPSPNRLWLNQAGASFVNPPGLPTEEIGNNCDTAGDIDHDGFDELIVCGGGGQLFPTVFRAYDNSGGTTWSDATAALGLPTFAHSDAELADLNRDGWLDLVTVRSNRLEVRLNVSGRFPSVNYSLALSDGRDLAVGDAEGDGDQDIYVVQGTNATVPDLLLLNRGSGASYESFPGLPQVTTGDGDTAQAIPNWKGTNRAAFLVNNGRAYPEPGPRQLIELIPPSRCAGKPATIIGTAGRDRLVGTQRRDVIAGLGGRDIVRAGKGDDIVCAGPGKDKVTGGAGNDKLFGGKGRDRLLGGKGKDKLFGGPNLDTCAGGPGKDAEKGC